jgi:hypothetical protein
LPNFSRYTSLHRRYPTQHSVNTLADVFADSGFMRFGSDARTEIARVNGFGTSSPDF